MKTKQLVIAVAFAFNAAGCSSFSLPSLPWSSSVTSDPTAEALFEDGTRYFSEKKYVRALDAFNKIITDHPFSPLLTEAELKAADSYYLNQQYPEAINAFKEFQSMHPTNEHVPFVVYRLGLAHFDQFSSVDREQKNTKIAKGYFETVITKYPKSTHARDARVKLAKCIDYLSEHDFQIAMFYLKDEKYPAARDRFEEIVRRYRDTPAAVKSLFYLGESYKHEKNGVKAALAYEALIQHYPKSPFAAQAKTELANLEKQKHDPLAMLLMRDRRPGSAPAPQQAQDPAIAKLKDVELIAKTEVVYEEPGDEKGFFRRVIDKVNPFASSNNNAKPAIEKEPETWQKLVLKNKEKKDSGGLFSWLNPFSPSDDPGKKKTDDPKSAQLVERIDDSLKERGIDANIQSAALKPPTAALPDIPESDVRDATPKTMETAKLIDQIDSSLKKDGKSVDSLPPPPEAAEIFKNPAAVQEIIAKQKANMEPSRSAAESGLLSSIDQKLEAQGVAPSKLESPPAAVAPKEKPTKSEPPKAVELEPKISVEKGPLFLAPGDVQTPPDSAPAKDSAKPAVAEKEQEPEFREIPKSLVRGPNPPQNASAAPKEPEKKNSTFTQEEERGVFDQLKSDIDTVSKALNPFNW